MHQRMKRRIPAVYDLFCLHLRIVCKRTGIINQKDRHIAQEDYQKRAPCAERLLFFLLHARYFRYQHAHQHQQHDPCDGKGDCKTGQRCPCRRHACLVNLRAERKQQRIDDRSQRQDENLPDGVFLPYILHNILHTPHGQTSQAIIQ